MKTYQCLNCGKDCQSSHQKRNKYCSLFCQQEFQHKTYIAEWKKGKQHGSRGAGQISSHVKKYLFDKFNKTCCICGMTNEWQGKELIMEIEHKDGCSDNNDEENLILICPNCHSQTSTYKGRNKGNGRYVRKLRYQERKSY